MPNRSQHINLAKVFDTVADVLAANQDKLNKLDDYNHDHGDNMVRIFKAATDALQKSKDSSISASLADAADQVADLPSGSAATYAEGFTRAAKEFKGRRKLDADDAISLISALMGSEKPDSKSSGGEALSSLVTSLASGVQEEGESPVGGLLGALTGRDDEDDEDIDAGDVAGMLLRGGMAFLEARNEGDDPLAAGVQALLSTSQVGESSHRQESASLVAKGLLAALPSLLAK